MSNDEKVEVHTRDRIYCASDLLLTTDLTAYDVYTMCKLIITLDN